MSTISLISGPVPVLALAAGAAGLGWLVVKSRRYLVRVVPVALIAAGGLTLVLVYVAENIFHWWDDTLPPILYIPAGLTFLALLLIVPRIRARSGSRLVAVVAGVVSVVLVAVASASFVNVHFGQYPTLASALGDTGVSDQPISSVAAGPNTPGTPATSQSTWTAPPTMPTGGTIYSVTIPGPVSGYASAPALVYLPPAYLAAPKASNLPVLVLFHGLPGSPVDWVNGGQIAQVMDTFAAAHDGLAPVVIIPDITNNGASDPPLCMDTKVSKSDTYLSVDLPAWVESTLGAGTASARQWAIAGYSYGGTCTMQLATNDSEVYPTFIDIAGETEPTVEGGRSAVISTYFAGDASAFTDQNALDRLTNHSFPDSAGIVVVGATDTTYRSQGQQVFDVAHASGMDVTEQVLPGGHSWQVWKPGLVNNLDWLAQRMGLIK
ncbi:esterase [Arthrobacter echini]|uniref:Esterase n=1 Tax=Arthrobacter echini TaxID=1529066 RepID=A0A4S5E2H1_9MICC|nr:alpha/beta fold hydrolase [Arthrobacter echini]THJ65588.1 esterase [Arthrobacter echini]